MPDSRGAATGRNAKRSRAVQLAQMLLDGGEITIQRLSAVLAVPPQILQSYLNGRQAMPFDRQVCVATLLIEKYPSHAKEGRQLRDQLRATVRYESGETARHSYWTGHFGDNLR